MTLRVFVIAALSFVIPVLSPCYGQVRDYSIHGEETIGVCIAQVSTSAGTQKIKFEATRKYVSAYSRTENSWITSAPLWEVPHGTSILSIKLQVSKSPNSHLTLGVLLTDQRVHWLTYTVNTGNANIKSEMISDTLPCGAIDIAVGDTTYACSGYRIYATTPGKPWVVQVAAIDSISDFSSIVIDSDGSVYAGNVGLYIHPASTSAWRHAGPLGYIYSLAIDAKHRLHAALQDSVLTSSDTGNTWLKDSIELKQFSNLTSLHADANGNLYGADVFTGMWKLADGSRTWTQLPNTPVDWLSTHGYNICNDIATSPLSIATEFGSYTSPNDGATWYKDPDGPTNTVASLLKTSDGTLFAENIQGVYSKRPEDSVWNASLSPKGFYPYLKLSRDGDTIYAACFTTTLDMGIWYTSDNGSSWVPYRNSPTRLSQSGFASNFFIDERGSQYIFSDSGKIYVKPKGGAWRISKDFGSGVGELTATFVSNHHGLVYLFLGVPGSSTPYYLLQYDMAMDNWTIDSAQRYRSISDVAVSNNGTLYIASADSGIFERRGATWNSIPSP